MIITYYSYKGGVGRSQLCANVASYLCYRKGKKVLLMDWDFEAPGLHYFFGKGNNDVCQNGTIELLDKYVQLMRTNSNVVKEDYTYYDQTSFIPLISEEETNNGGKIDMIPAGNYLESYVFKVNTFDWYEFYEMLDGKTYIENFKRWINSLDYDYVFIDSRTGITDYSGICNIQLPDANVVVMAANNQNFEGSKRIINQILTSEYTNAGFRKAIIFPILSRININQPNFNSWADKFTDFFYEQLGSLDNNVGLEFSKEAFKGFYLDKTMLVDEMQFSAGENLLISDKESSIPRNSFISKFVNLGEYLLKISDNGNIGLSDQIDKETWELWANNAELKGDSSKAAIAFDNAGNYDRSILNGGTVNSYFNVGNKFFLKDKDKAIEYYKKAIQLEPDFYIAYFNCALAYNHNNEKDNAIKYFKKVIEINPTDYDAIYYIGLIYYEKNEFEKAIEIFQQAILINPNDYNTYHQLGLSYIEIGDMDTALEYYEKSINIEPNCYESYNNMGLIFESKKEMEKAIECYQKALEISPNNSDILRNMGIAFRNDEKYDKSIECYELALEISPNDHELYYNFGITYDDKSNYDKSIECYLKSIEIKADYYPAYINVGFSFFKIMEIIKAETYLLKGIELFKDEYGLMNLGHVYLSKKEEERALGLYLESFLMFKEKNVFWKSMEADFQYIELYDVSRENYNLIVEKIHLFESNLQ